MKKESEKSNNPFNQIKYSFEFNILPAKSFTFDVKNTTTYAFKKAVYATENSFTNKGFYQILPHPPQFI